jgi:hypothetical protein
VQDQDYNAVADTFEDDRPTLDVTFTDRRRPGRRDYQDPHLIALLRGQPTITDPATAEVDAITKVLPADDLAPARGILIELPIAAAMWAVAISAIWQFM